MKFSTELAIGSELDVDALVEAKPDEIERLLHGALLFVGCRHCPLSRARSKTLIRFQYFSSFLLRLKKTKKNIS